MIAGVFSGPDAQVVAAIVALTGVLAGLWVQNRKVHRDNRSDHAATMQVVGELRTDVREMRADVRDVRDEVRSHGDRLRILEHLPIPPKEHE